MKLEINYSHGRSSLLLLALLFMPRSWCEGLEKEDWKEAKMCDQNTRTKWRVMGKQMRVGSLVQRWAWRWSTTWFINSETVSNNSNDAMIGSLVSFPLLLTDSILAQLFLCLTGSLICSRSLASFPISPWNKIIPNIPCKIVISLMRAMPLPYYGYYLFRSDYK